MEKIRRERTQLRRLFTNALTDFIAKFKTKLEFKEDLFSAFKVLEDKADRLFAIDEALKELWLDVTDFKEDEYEKDLDSVEEYRNKFINAKGDYDYFVTQQSCTLPVDQQSSASVQGKRHFRLPKLVLTQFDGEIRNWLKFWGQFKKIHSDEEIDNEDKFQYLIQATEPGSSARELVESFPPSGDNYVKAIDLLKGRFARDELLIEVYVRELLNIVLAKNAGKNNTSLSALYDKLETQLRALETLGVTSEKYAAMLYPLVESALPEDTLRVWERARKAKTESETCNQPLNNLLEFLKLEVESEERIQIARSGFAEDNFISNVQTKDKIPTAACIFAGDKNQDKTTVCIWCDKKSHRSTECFKVSSLSYEEKKGLLKKKKGCFKCFRVGHNAKNCKYFVKCQICTKGHHTLMCYNFGNSNKKQNSEPGESSEVLLSHKNMTTLLQTILIKIIGNGKSGVVRALFDNGSQRSYLRRDIAVKLNIKHSDEERISHSLFGGIETEEEFHKIYDLNLQSIDDKFTCQISVLDKNKICGYVPRMKTQNVFPVLRERNVTLSDIGKDVPEIGLLIGADFSGSLMTGSMIQLGDNIVAIETKLGWTIQGPRIESNCLLTNVMFSTKLDLSNLWDLEIIGIKDPVEVKTKENLDNEVTEFFSQTVQMNKDGRYEVHLPWREGHPDLEHNRKLAERRLFSLTRRLDRIGKLKEYDKIFEEWKTLGIIEAIPEDEEKLSGHYIPHQAVMKTSSTTTKLRPVFDASAKDDNGNSLNMCLEKGPNLVELLPKLLMQFRKHAVGVTSDIKKAFLQISLQPNDRDFLKFLWWEDVKQKKIVCYRHCRVVFGLAPSPFLLAATIHFHLNKSSATLKESADHLKQSFYVDNCVTSFETEEEADKFIDESKKLLSSAQFDLRGWICAPTQKKEGTEENPVLILGMFWDTETDKLFCGTPSLQQSQDCVTKRTLLSMAHKTFDTIGFTSPLTLIPKLILQKAWKLKKGWDDELPADMKKEFQKWLSDMEFLNKCRIPRRLTPGPISDCQLSLHIFCDASRSSYAACIFLRASSATETTTRLVVAKSRVAPVKEITIPRLELMAALIATRLYCTVKDALKSYSCEIYFWSDSTVALTWIKRKDNWSVFVQNRVKEINQYSNSSDWHHVPGSMNPADLASRGCSARALFNSRWWEGPSWLKKEPIAWAVSEYIASEDEVNAEKRKTIVSNVSSEISDFTKELNYFSKYTKIVRMVGWMFRFINNCRNKNLMKKGTLEFEEVQLAEKRLFWCIQQEAFQGKKIKVIKDMMTFKDNERLLRIKTKLILGDEPEEFKCPILLPGKHDIVARLVYDRHCQLQHAGKSILLANLRETYWILGVKKSVRKIYSKCAICQRHTVKPVSPPFAPLPRDRVKYAAVFEVTGVDLAGPLFLKTGEKCWIVIFTCAIYRALHLELAKSLSTETFIMALRRFIARRGRISVIYSDNGGNFIGTNNTLNEIDWDAVLSFSMIQKIKWHFNPPTAAWWGGWWERMVRSVKELLRRVLGKATVNYVELETILCDCESTINSRPLTYVSDDSQGLKPLTPAKFLQGIPRSDVPDLDIIDGTSYNKRYRYLQKLREDLRTRFRNEYLAMLIHHGQRKGDVIKVGDVVLIETDKKRVNWPLGLVIEVFKGSDSNIRVAKLKTADGERIRPVQRLYKLEVTQSDEEFSVITKPDEEFASFTKKHEEPTAFPKSGEFSSKNSENEEEVSESTTPQPTVTRCGRRVKIPKRMDL